jgi:hypothetical protein
MKAWQGMKLFVGIRLFGRAILKVLCPYLKRQERVIIQLVAQRNIKTIELGSLFPRQDGRDGRTSWIRRC